MWDDELGWIRSGSSPAKPASNADSYGDGFQDILRDYLPDGYNEGQADIVTADYDFDYGNYFYNPFPVLSDMMGTGENPPVVKENTFGDTVRPLPTPGPTGGVIEDIEDIFKLVDDLEAGKNAEDIFTTKPTPPTRSTKYIPPPPPLPTKTTRPSGVVVTPPPIQTTYRPPVKQYVTEPETTVPPPTTLVETTTNITTTISTTPEATKKMLTQSTKKKKKRKRPNLRQGIPTGKETGLAPKIYVDPDTDPDEPGYYTDEPKIECADIDAIKEMVYGI